MSRVKLALPPPRADRQRLAQRGQMFRRALEPSRRQPDTMRQRTAWGSAEATAASCVFVEQDLHLAPVLRASVAKLGS